MVFCECESGWLAVFASRAAAIAPKQAKIMAKIGVFAGDFWRLDIFYRKNRPNRGFIIWGNSGRPWGKYGQPTTLTLAKHHFTHTQPFLARFRATKARFRRFFSIKNVPSPEFASENVDFGHDFGLFWGNCSRPRGKYGQPTTLTLAKHHFTHTQPFLARFRAMKARFGRFFR